MIIGDLLGVSIGLYKHYVVSHVTAPLRVVM
jgi:hypothetical protein